MLKGKKLIASMMVGILVFIFMGGTFIFAKPKPVKLVYWTHLANHPKWNDWYRQKGKEFAKLHPEVSGVEVVVVPFEGYEAKYLSAFMAKAGAPDIFLGTSYDWAGHYQFSDPCPPKFTKKIDTTATEDLKLMGNWANKRYGVPTSGSNFMMLFINEDMFKEAGLDPNQPPETIDQFVDYAKKITKYDSNGKITKAGYAIRYLGQQVGLTEKFNPFLHTFGARMVSPDWKKGSGYINSKQAIAALQFYADLVQKHKVSSLEVGSPENAFGQGLAAMVLRESWYVGWLRDNAPKIKYKVYPLPTEKVKVGSGCLFQWCNLVYKNSPNKKWAWEFLNYIWNEKDDLEQYELIGFAPAFKSNVDSSYMKNRPDYQATVEMLKNRKPAPSYDHPKSLEVSNVVGDAITEALFKKKTPEQALNDAAKRIDAILK